jgi:hypothetical protein
MNNVRLLGILFFTLLSIGLHSQEKFELAKADQKFIVKGTSSLHDWHMESNEGLGSCLINQTNGSLNVQNAEVKFKAESLKSGKNGMDKNAYKALKTKEAEWIDFKLSSFELADGGKGIAKGNLTVAGFTKSVTFQVEMSQKSDLLTVTGTTTFLLTDFKIEPPTALLGTIKTGDEVTIEFNLTFKN